ncbi:hypothetical protein NMS_0941 [Nonlabens marinus S1-08]|uniref:Uncharacterized protein n=1 Tax=Nonlabens marinus S1-08 TaxID=1454201 RepID=W8VQ96_9FLAO|nr:hypothetical protein NMS_0941 [Nonlabens marinus S1-08]
MPSELVGVVRASRCKQNDKNFAFAKANKPPAIGLIIE